MRHPMYHSNLLAKVPELTRHVIGERRGRANVPGCDGLSGTFPNIISSRTVKSHNTRELLAEIL
jgi:hypothetical protein